MLGNPPSSISYSPSTTTVLAKISGLSLTLPTVFCRPNEATQDAPPHRSDDLRTSPGSTRRATASANSVLETHRSLSPDPPCRIQPLLPSDWSPAPIVSDLARMLLGC